MKTGVKLWFFFRQGPRDLICDFATLSGPIISTLNQIKMWAENSKRTDRKFFRSARFIEFRDERERVSLQLWRDDEV